MYRETLLFMTFNEFLMIHACQGGWFWLLLWVHYISLLLGGGEGWQQLTFKSFPILIFSRLHGRAQWRLWDDGQAASVKLLHGFLHFLQQSLTIQQYPIIWRTMPPHCQLHIRPQFLGVGSNIWLALKGLLHSCSASNRCNRKIDRLRNSTSGYLSICILWVF